MGLLNKIYGLVHAGRYLLNIFCDDKFEELVAGRRVFRKFDDREMKMVVLIHMNDILAHAQVTMERFAADLGEKFKVKSIIDTFDVDKTSKALASSGRSIFSACG